MKATYLTTAAALGLTFAIAACSNAVESPAPAPAPPPRTTPSPMPAPPPIVTEPDYEYYLDAPQTPGDWTYQLNASGPIAVFIGAGEKGEFLLSCDRARGEIGLWRAGTSATARSMRIETETVTRTLQVVQAEDTNPYLTTSLPARDPLLDAMAITKGRFAIGVEGERTLFLPAWTEVTRVIEDCR